MFVKHFIAFVEYVQFGPVFLPQLLVLSLLFLVHAKFPDQEISSPVFVALPFPSRSVEPHERQGGEVQGDQQDDDDFIKFCIFHGFID